MDESEPRHHGESPPQSHAAAAPSGDAAAEQPPSPLRLLKSVTVLAEAEETPANALEDWSRGLDWVRWLFSSVRQRLEHLHFTGPEGPLAALASDRERQLRLSIAWEAFAAAELQPLLGPTLHRAWHAAQSGRLEDLLRADRDLTAHLPAARAQASLEAGSILLRSTRGARYQGLLGRYRLAQEEGGTPGHFIIVWPLVAHFFQLGLTNVFAEYLRLEWDMAARHGLREPPALSLATITRLTARLIHSTAGAPSVGDLRVVA